MSWGDTLNECWILLKQELSKKEIYYIEIFMNLTFKDLYEKMNSEECIDNYENLISFEDRLEELIQKKVELSQVECKKYKELFNKNTKDKFSFVSLITEKFDSINYDKNKYPNYENFYYTDYLDEEYISKELKHMDKDKYLILNRYLEYIETKNRNEKKKEKDIDYYSLDNLNTFITVLNLFNEKYNHSISRYFAENQVLEDNEIYRKNKDIIDNFILFINNLQESEKKGKKDKKEKEKEKKEEKKRNNEKNWLELNAKNHLSDFLIDSENKYGKKYIIILRKFIERQNNELENLIKKKIKDGKIDNNSANRINIQQIKEDEIFTFNIPDKFLFINETFNSSYRKIIDNKNYEIYNSYFINYDYIEENMTNLLLKNKKLLKDEII